MTDMSPKAITERLRLMDELWLLSVKLMNAKVIAGNASPSRKDRDSIREVLFFDWDPIGISELSSIDDEYDSYIAPIYRILVGSRSEDEIVDRLLGFERDSMGLPGREPETVRPVARKLLELKSK